MTALDVLTGCWFLVIAALVVQGAPPRVRRRVPAAATTPAERTSPVQRLGSFVRRTLRRPPNRAADGRLGAIVVAAAMATMVAPMLAPAGGAAAFIVSVGAARRRRRDDVDRVVRELPEVIDLLSLSLAAGGSIPTAVREVSRVASGPVSAALAEATARIEAGHRLADALGGVVAETSEHAAPLVRALADADLYGTGLTLTLHRLASEARATRRRRAETAARQVPVRMLLPLVVCVLPAFVLLSLVPMLAGTLRDIDLSPMQ